MKISHRIAAAAAALLAFHPAARAQVAEGGQPLGLERPFPESAPVLVVPPPDAEAYRAEDEARGPGAVMSASGSQSHLANDLRLITSGCPPGVAGIYFCGTAEALIPLGNGFRCIANPLTRLALVQADGSGVAGHDLDVTGTPIDPGETWYFQWWYRDPAAGGANFDLSDALEVPFCN